MKNLFSVIILLLTANFALAQSDDSIAQPARQRYIGVETGMASVESDMLVMDNVRGDIPYYSSNYMTNSLTGLSTKVYFGVKQEVFSYNNKWSFASGLRFSRVTNSIGKDDYWSGGTNFFYWLHNEEGPNTEYLRVKEIEQKTDYIGIPLEVKFFPFERRLRKPRVFRIYFKVGGEINFAIQSKADVVFDNEDMNQFKSDLTAKIGKPNTLSSSLYGAGGIRFGKPSGPAVSFEIAAPYSYVTQETSGLVNPLVGAGCQLNIQIPIKSKAK